MEIYPTVLQKKTLAIEHDQFEAENVFSLITIDYVRLEICIRVFFFEMQLKSTFALLGIKTKFSSNVVITSRLLLSLLPRNYQTFYLHLDCARWLSKL